MTRSFSRAGRQSRHTSEYHMRLHVEAVKVACEMLAMLKTGKTYFEVGKEYGITEAAVKARLKRQGLKP